MISLKVTLRVFTITLGTDAFPSFYITQVETMQPFREQVAAIE
ncbi:hypothetical protein CLV36_10650 [Laceyella sediminis]|uniref:Uncharacterized protein n=1 Tax=Laceyella sediminis TaxID=573074 RepID=A0ABX5EQI8_9BACL|nr:hypothetical protein CLV36_10650 [Laceyella sediminis]